MDTNYLENNNLTLVGKVTSEKRFSHEIYGESFYSFDLQIPRLSGSEDIIPVTVSERLINDEMMQIGTTLLIKGQFRSYNSYENEKNRLILTVFAKDVKKLEEDEQEHKVDENGNEIIANDFARKDIVTNEVVLIGYICKKPVYRQTPFGREIADILLAVNRAYNKSDYIPSIAWGRNARFCQNLEVGTEVKIVGRIQSRQYEKKYEDGTIENKVCALSDRVAGGKVMVLDELKLDKIATKDFAKIMSNLNAGPKALVVIADNDKNVVLSARNIPDVKTSLTGEINTYDVMNARTLILTKDAVAKIEEVYA